MIAQGILPFKRVDEEVAVAIGQRLATPEYTLDVDATVIESEKQEARWTYKKVRGYQPMLGFLAESGVCLAHEFREGNVGAQSGALKFLRRSLKRCPQIKRLRSDSAFYQGEVIKAIHLVAKASEAQRLVVQRWRELQLRLFEPSGYCYSAIITNRNAMSR